jgi:hypothetical protein
MLNNVTLDVAIGFCFIFLLYSLLSTTVKEFLATIFDYRARMLERGLEQMLDGKNYRYFWWEKWINGLIFGYYRLMGEIPKKLTYAKFVSSTKDNTVLTHAIKRLKLNKKSDLFASKITSHPLYLRSGENTHFFKKPSYLKADTFSDILLDVLNPHPGTLSTLQEINAQVSGRRPAPMKEDLQAILLIYIRQANGDCQRFKLLTEDWFNATMDRVSGWYRRQAQFLLLGIGLFLAFAFNIDSIAIYKILAKDRDAREGIVQLASHSRPQLQTVVLSQGSPQPDKQPSIDLSKDPVYQNLVNQDDNSRDVFGLNKDSTLNGSYWPCSPNWLKFSKKQAGGFTTLLGFIITAIAVSLGAPFWFDMLNKLVNIRVAGSKPDPPKADTSKTADLNKRPDPAAKG